MSFPPAAARPIRLVGRVILFVALLAVLVPVSPGSPARAHSPESGSPEAALPESAVQAADAAAGTTARPAARLAAPPPDRRWVWPVAAPHPVVRSFAAPATAYGAGHRGIDVGAASESPVVAPDDGVVFFAGVVVDRPVLSIAHSGGLVSSYEPVSSALPAGTPVGRGSVVGTLLPGHCAESCLHFGVRLHGEYVSPLNYLGGVPRAVLLPTRAAPGSSPSAQHARASRLSLTDAQPP